MNPVYFPDGLMAENAGRDIIETMTIRKLVFPAFLLIGISFPWKSAQAQNPGAADSVAEFQPGVTGIMALPVLEQNRFLTQYRHFMMGVALHETAKGNLTSLTRDSLKRAVESAATIQMGHEHRRASDVFLRCLFGGKDQQATFHNDLLAMAQYREQWKGVADGGLAEADIEGWDAEQIREFAGIANDIMNRYRQVLEEQKSQTDGNIDLLLAKLAGGLGRFQYNDIEVTVDDLQQRLAGLRNLGDIRQIIHPEAQLRPAQHVQSRAGSAPPLPLTATLGLQREILSRVRNYSSEPSLGLMAIVAALAINGTFFALGTLFLVAGLFTNAIPPWWMPMLLSIPFTALIALVYLIAKAYVSFTYGSQARAAVPRKN